MRAGLSSGGGDEGGRQELWDGSCGTESMEWASFLAGVSIHLFY